MSRNGQKNFFAPNRDGTPWTTRVFRITTIRIVSQTLFFALFMFLLWMTWFSRLGGHYTIFCLLPESRPRGMSLAKQSAEFEAEPVRKPSPRALERAMAAARTADDNHYPDQESKAQRLVGSWCKLAIESCQHRTGNSYDG